jgi:hypothetical protein
MRSASADRPEPVAVAGLRTSFDACMLIDDLGPSATGEIVVSGVDGPKGAVFVERGRVCWAAARGLARRLSELLGSRAAIGAHAMEEVFVTCKAERIPLGEHLVSRGLLRSEDLREALLQHTVECLHQLCTPDARAAFSLRSGRGYSPRFTFATTELLAHLGAATHPDVAARLRPVLEASFGEEGWAAAFVRSPTSAWPEPIAVHGSAPRAVRALLRFGKWAASALDVSVAFSDDSALFMAFRNDGALVAFRQDDAVVAGETGLHGPARILNHRAQQRRKRG